MLLATSCHAYTMLPRAVKPVVASLAGLTPTTNWHEPSSRTSEYRDSKSKDACDTATNALAAVGLPCIWCAQAQRLRRMHAQLILSRKSKHTQLTHSDSLWLRCCWAITDAELRM